MKILPKRILLLAMTLQAMTPLVKMMPPPKIPLLTPSFQEKVVRSSRRPELKVTLLRLEELLKLQRTLLTRQTKMPTKLLRLV